MILGIFSLGLALAFFAGMQVQRRKEKEFFWGFEPKMEREGYVRERLVAQRFVTDSEIRETGNPDLLWDMRVAEVIEELWRQARKYATITRTPERVNNGVRLTGTLKVYKTQEE